MQSIYHCLTLYDIKALVSMNTDPTIFLNTYLELDRRNLVSILSFDSATMQQILKEENESYFQKDYPVFYKNKRWD